MSRRLLVALCSLLIVAQGVPAQISGRDIIIDTDMGLDDVRALFAILADSVSTVRGIVTVEGSASLGKGTDNLIGLLESLDRDEIPVYRGTRRIGAQSPPWRSTADALAGNPFPPPRHVTALDAHDGLDDLIKDAGAPPLYLALGPLGNLAALEPEAIGKIGSIWLPAVVADGTLQGWNLEFDTESAVDVLSRAGDIVVVDVGPARGLDALSILEAVEGSSAAASWIERLLADAGGHLMIYDEIAALALLRPELVAIDRERYNVVGAPGDLRIETSGDGTVRIARITDMEALTRELETLWERETERGHHHNAAGESAPIDPELYIKTFHGHLGPYLVLGYRMGRIALRELGSAGHFGLSVTVHSRLSPPASCLIDGVQLGSGCTLGKRNIEITGTDGAAYAEFTSDRGERITIGLREDVPRLVAEMIRESGVEEAGDGLFHMSEDSLFVVRRE